LNTSTGETIVVVEDEARVRFLVGRALVKAGYDVLEAPDARTGFRLVEAHAGRVRLLVTDVVMPRGSGRHLYEQVRRIQPHLPILFMSGYPDETVALEGRAEAGTGFLRKPFSPEQLRAKVRAMLDSDVVGRQSARTRFRTPTAGDGTLRRLPDQQACQSSG
jgi:hypothetical protein